MSEIELFKLVVVVLGVALIIVGIIYVASLLFVLKNAVKSFKTPDITIQVSASNENELGFQMNHKECCGGLLYFNDSNICCKKCEKQIYLYQLKPDLIASICNTLKDNTNRSVSNVRHHSGMHSEGGFTSRISNPWVSGNVIAIECT